MLFVWWIQDNIGWDMILKSWKKVSAGNIFVVVCLFLLSYAARAMRVFDTFSSNVRGQFLSCLRLILIHNFFNNILPMRTGEIAFPVFIKRYFSVQPTISIPTLLWWRFLDLHFLIVVALCVLWHVQIPIMIFFYTILLLLPIAFWLMRRWIQRSFSGRHGLISDIMKHLSAGIPDNLFLLFRIWLLTAFNWTIKLLIFAWLLRQFAQISLVQAFVGSITGEFSSVLPVHGFAGAGTYEASVVAGMMSLGLKMGPAVAAATNLHLFILGASTMSAGLALCILPASNKKRGNR